MGAPQNYINPSNGHCIPPATTSVPINAVYAMQEPMPQAHENQIDTSVQLGSKSESISPPRLSPIKPNGIPIKQEHDIFAPSFPDNNNPRVCCVYTFLNFHR